MPGSITSSMTRSGGAAPNPREHLAARVEVIDRVAAPLEVVPEQLGDIGLSSTTRMRATCSILTDRFASFC